MAKILIVGFVFLIFGCMSAAGFVDLKKLNKKEEQNDRG